MKIFEIIKESRSADLYHGTTPANAEEILKTNRMNAHAPFDRAASAFVRGKTEFKSLIQGVPETVSFSRSMSAAKSFSSGSPRRFGITGVVFVLDQETMWRDLGKRITPYNDLYATSGDSRSRGTEYEEMVLGDILNVDRYIKEVFVFVHPNYRDAVNPDQFPVLLSHPKSKLVINNAVKDTPSIYDRFPSRREFDKNHKIVIPNLAFKKID